jgi:hypothetical protein
VTALPWLATREQIMSRMGVQYTAYASRKVDEALESWTRTIELQCQRPGGFHPTLRTLTFDWPTRAQGTSWRLWLAPDEVISVVSLTSGGVAITGSILTSGEGTGYGPPYNQLQLDRSGSQFFGTGSSGTPQRSISLVAWTGWSDDQRRAGSLSGAVSSASATTLTVTDASAVGVGDQLVVGSERIVVVGRSMAATGQTITSDVSANAATVTVPVTSGAAFTPGEVILVNSERMLVVDIAGNNLTVKRFYDGSVLAAHTSGAAVYAPRLLSVERGCCGSTAATHADATAVYRWAPPAPARALCIGETINQLQQEDAGFARQVGDGEYAREVSARGLKDLRKQVYETPLKRKGRSWAV